MKVENLKITKILPVEEGKTKAGKSWSKLTFVGETDQEYNNLYAFELFQGEGKDNVEKFKQYNKEGSVVNVEFNVQCREYNEKYYTTLSAWNVRSAEQSTNGSSETPSLAPNDSEDLPF